MNPLLHSIQGFSAAEEFFDYFDVNYTPEVVQVNRLHILKRFNQYLSHSPIPDDMDQASAFACCKAYLAQAHDDFVHSSGIQEKVFKVFQDQQGKTISLNSLKASLSNRS